MDIFKTYKILIEEQLEGMNLDDVKILDDYKRGLFQARSYVSRYSKTTGTKFQVKQMDTGTIYIKRVG